MSTETARATIKSINRQCRQGRIFGRDRYGADFATWRATYPKIARAYVKAAEVLTGRKGRFMPPVFGRMEW